MPKSNLYTRTGDKGTTALVDGSRIAKDDLRLDAYGTIDEFSSFLGVVISLPACNVEVKGQLLEIQNMLFNIGCYLATPPSEEKSTVVKGLDKTDLTRLEGWIDALDEQVPPLRAFVLPGGSQTAAHAHVARAVCRRAERRIISLSKKEYVAPILIEYINRLSDYLFILARYFNFIEGIAEITWKSS